MFKGNNINSLKIGIESFKQNENESGQILNQEEHVQFEYLKMMNEITEADDVEQSIQNKSVEHNKNQSEQQEQDEIDQIFYKKVVHDYKYAEIELKIQKEKLEKLMKIKKHVLEMLSLIKRNKSCVL